MDKRNLIVLSLPVKKAERRNYSQGQRGWNYRTWWKSRQTLQIGSRLRELLVFNEICRFRTTGNIHLNSSVMNLKGEIQR